MFCRDWFLGLILYEFLWQFPCRLHRQSLPKVRPIDLREEAIRPRVRPVQAVLSEDLQVESSTVSPQAS